MELRGSEVDGLSVAAQASDGSYRARVRRLAERQLRRHSRSVAGELNRYEPSLASPQRRARPPRSTEFHLLALSCRIGALFMSSCTAQTRLSACSLTTKWPKCRKRWKRQRQRVGGSVQRKCRRPNPPREKGTCYSRRYWANQGPTCLLRD